MRFDALLDNFKKAKEALRKRKDERDWWMERARKLERLAKAAEQQHGIRILDEIEADAPGTLRSTNIVPDSQVSGLEAMTPPAAQPTPDGDRNASVEDVQLQSTQGDPDEAETEDLPPLPASDECQDPIVVKEEPSSDLPVVVSERTLKRRRVEGDGDADAATPRIKAEPNRSSPITASEHYQFDIQESIDLDDIAQKITTPRKRKDLEGLAAEDQGGGLRTASRMASKFGYALVDEVQNPAKNIRAASVLTPVSGNKRTTKWAVDEKDALPVKDGLAHGISALAEDGTPYGKQRLGKSSAAKHAANSAAKGRLDELLNSPTPGNASTISRTPQARQPRCAPAEDTPLGLLFPEPRELPFDKTTRQTKKRQSLGAELAAPLKKMEKKPSTRDKSPPASRASASALRYKPLSELRLDDFKINPLSNDGHDFAYSEVVRDKDDRAGLRGCTDMHCCGKHFRALALSQRPNPPLTAAQRQEEQRLLENYLGDCAYRLASMTKDERDEAWIEAKTEELANKYGRHRHRHFRMQSPPGFWNADFPDTQELAADKEEALKREKRAIADRHREAMRPGGMWLFRDE
ncbi:ubiquitin thiolesterase [Trichoderma cornu-damae]|uniref:Ubiquitin thiolesterase n=1 Tax=Trichoderma cornu-damae TaxID=654480 RepID=A0A9P8QGT7_9HYPO|nr:ubiquitin thiolesterase [Trichoderma cornu-damae]